jgi:hypothetical protein
VKVTTDQFEAFLELLARRGVPLNVSQEIAGDAIMVAYKDIVIGIEPDGYTHS